MKYGLVVACIFLSVFSFAQNSFTYSPLKPRPGDEITFSFTPSGALAGMVAIPNAFVVESSVNGYKLTDITLSRSYGKLEGKFKTAASTAFVALGFMKDDQYDVNNDDGYTILMFENNQPVTNSYALAADFYSKLGKQRFGMITNDKKALLLLEDEMKCHPENRENVLFQYYRALQKVNPARGADSVQNNIELSIGTLKTEADYKKLSGLYNILRLNKQSRFIDSLKDQKFPPKPQELAQLILKFDSATNLEQKKQILEAAKQLAITKEASNYAANSIDVLMAKLATGYFEKNDFTSFVDLANGFNNNDKKYRLFNEIIMRNQNKEDKAIFVEKLAKEATLWAKNERVRPTEAQPPMTTQLEWEEARKERYMNVAVAYSKVLFTQKKYKEGIKYAKEVALDLGREEKGYFNNNYLQFAQKTMSQKEVQSLAERFFIGGKSGDYPKTVLKEIYVRQNNSDTGFDNYLHGLSVAAANKKLENIRKEVLNIPAPDFSLKDTDGKTVRLSDFTGKVVVLDFWATWCGPCKASFPAMQKMVEKYKHDAGVQFLFIDTWEQGEDVLQTVTNFIKTNRYDFHVLMDTESMVVRDYRISGIPAKFIIGRDGKIKFQETGFYGLTLI